MRHGLPPRPSSGLSWSLFITPSTLQLHPLLEVLLEPVPDGERELLRLGLQEALVNAVRHGNREDPRKSLRIRRILLNGWFVWQIQDEGPGIPVDRRLPEAPEAPSGRGLFLIRQCFDDIRWSPRGNRVQLAKRRQDSLDP
jgi:serine/threonine-protein kinase RsbW